MPAISNFKASEKGWIGEIDGVKPGATRETTMTLKPGRYEVICNFPGHYQLGMRSMLTVGACAEASTLSVTVELCTVPKLFVTFTK